MPHDAVPRSDRTGEVAEDRVLRVETIKASRTNENYRTALFYGVVEPIRSAWLDFDMPGRVDTVLRDVGDRVSAGEPLATLESGSLRQNREEARQDLDSIRSELNGLSQRPQSPAVGQQISQLESRARSLEGQLAEANEQLSARSIRAPFSGTVTERLVSVGATAQPGRRAFLLADEAEVRLRADVAPAVAERCEVGDRAWASANEGLVPLEVEFKSQQINPISQTVTLRLKWAQNADPGLAIGQVIEVRQWERIDVEGYWAPLDSIDRGNESSWSVYVASPTDDASVIEERDVEPVLFTSKHALLTGELIDGDLVVANGLNRIVARQRVKPRVIETSYVAEGPPLQPERGRP